MKEETKKTTLKVIKYGAIGTGLAFGAPYLGEGLIYVGAFGSGAYVLNKVFFKNWKTTIATISIAGTAYLLSPFSKDVREQIISYKESDLRKENIELIEENENLKNQFENSIDLFNKEKVRLIDSVKTNEEIKYQKILFGEIKNFQEKNLEQITSKYDLKINIVENGLNQVKNNQKEIVSATNNISKQLSSVEKKLETSVNEYFAKEQTKDITNSLDIKNQEQEKNINDLTSKEYWTILEQGESLGKIAIEYYDNVTMYKNIAEMSGIKNPDQVEIGQPIKLPKKGLLKLEDLQTEKYPEKTILLEKGQILEKVIQQIYDLTDDQTKSSAKKIIEYNQKIGNKYLTKNPVIYNKIIIGIPGGV
ncbi:LysM peptidoglycan-binding domain-containing protein [Candidatus Woesearchaeota archaeon]|nr:LysM peptidoglycan-binding domain-containing protein [Candidatus Woesearchaeota archaeon]MCF7900949.1 LysM peptidoglycan-binding domain-containing protein [Candidatus Woesearchaeota archaeon]MCF8013605.1 LysM peptidoglycan-binding domain-containing protein [Candidatus Woesearchaeota archaeon]